MNMTPIVPRLTSTILTKKMMSGKNQTVLMRSIMDSLTGI